MHVAGTAALVLAFALHSAPLAGQRLLYGDRIRVRPPAPANEASGTEWTDGSVIRLAGDTLWYESPAGSLTPLSLSQNDVGGPRPREPVAPASGGSAPPGSPHNGHR